MIQGEKRWIEYGDQIILMMDANKDAALNKLIKILLQWIVVKESVLKDTRNQNHKHKTLYQIKLTPPTNQSQSYSRDQVPQNIYQE